MRELVTQIETEPDQEKFTSLVEELNRLLDSDTPPTNPAEPKP